MKKRLLLILLTVVSVMAARSEDRVILDWGRNVPWEMKYVFQEADEGIAPNADANGKQWYEVGYDDSAWDTLTGPIQRARENHWGLSEGSYYDWENDGGCFYLRRTFTIDLSTVNASSIGLRHEHDDYADYYINGTLVKAAEDFEGTALIPSAVLVDGENTLAIYVNDRGGGDAYIDFTIVEANDILSFISPYTDEQGVSYSYNEENEEWEVTGHNGKTSNFVIPASIMDKPVTSIADGVFGGGSCNSIILPEGLRHIGSDAFADGTLTSLTIPSTVTDLGYWSIIPGCASLTSLTVAEGNPVFDSRDNCNAIIRTEDNTVVETCPSTVLPSSVTRIGSCAYQRSSFAEFTIPISITCIEENAFCQCYNLEKVTVQATTPFELQGGFQDPGGLILIVPAGSKEAYQNASGWQDFGHIFEVSEEIVLDPMGYAYLSDEGATLNFVYDDQYYPRKDSGVTVYKLDEPQGEPRWMNVVNGNITKVVFDPSFADARPTTTHSWIREMPLEALVGLEYLNTSEVTSMNAMFYGSGNLTTLDLSTFDASQVEDTEYMFAYSGLWQLTLPLSLSHLNDNAFEGIGATEDEPCQLNVPDGFDFGEVDTSAESFFWRGGWFHTGTPIVKPYVVFNDGTLSFYCDDQRGTRIGSKYALNADDLPNWYHDGTTWSVTHVVIDESFANARPTWMRGWFREMPLESFEGLQYLNTSEVTSMESMFYNNKFFTSLDISHFDMSNVTDMSYMFGYCNNLVSLTLPVSFPYLEDNAFEGIGGENDPCLLNVPDGFDFGGADTSAEIFNWRSGWFHIGEPLAYNGPYVVLNEGTLTFYSDDQRANREGTYYKVPNGCPRSTVSLVVFDESYANERPSSTRDWFSGMTNLVEIQGLSNLNTSEVDDMAFMFNECSSLSSLDLSTFDASRVGNTDHMFSNCSSLTELTLPLSLNDLIDNACEGIGSEENPCELIVPSTFDVGDADTSADSFAWKGGWFHTSITLAYDGPYVVFNDGTLSFYCDDQRGTRGGNRYLLNTDDLPNWYRNDTHWGVTHVVIDESFANARPTSTRGWFREMPLESFEGLQYLNTSAVTSMESMFYNNKFFTSLDISHFDMSNVTDMGYMLAYCYNLTSLTLPTSFPYLEDNAFEGTGTENDPCQLNVSDGFDFGGADTSADIFNWRGGWFHIGEPLTYNGPYVVYDDGTLTFYCDDQRDNREGSVFKLREIDGEPEWYWKEERSSITRVVFDASFADARPVSTHSWLREMSITTIEGLEYLNTSEVTSMHAMFYHCSNLPSLDLSTFDTSNVTDMSYMFEGCSSLTSLDLSAFDASRVDNTERAFADCTNLTELTLPASLSNLYDNACEGIGSEDNPCLLNVTEEFDIGDETDTTADSFAWKGGWFHTNTPLTYNGPYVVYNDGTLTFYCDDQRGTHDGNKYKLNKADTEPTWLENSDNITTVVFDSSFTDARPTATTNWFANMTNLTALEGLSNLNTSSVTNMTNMFDNCSGLTTLDVSTFDTQNVNTMQGMFWGCSGLTTLDLSTFDTTSVENMHWMMAYCSNLSMLILPASMNLHNYDGACVEIGTEENPCVLRVPASFDLGNDVDTYADSFSWAGGWFWLFREPYVVLNNGTLTFYYDSLKDSREGAYDLGGNYDRESVSHAVIDKSMTNYKTASTAGWFQNMANLVDISGMENINITMLTDVSNMFENCSSLTELNLSDFDVTVPIEKGNTSGFLSGCSGLTDLLLHPSMFALDDNCCTGVGTEDSPCELRILVTEFDFGDADTTADQFEWKSGWFHFSGIPYAFISSDGLTLTFYCDYNYSQHKSANEEVHELNYRYTHRDITKVVFDSSFANARPTSTRWWFAEMEHLVSIEGLRYLNTSNVTDMSEMFRGCGLSGIDISTFDTQRVTTMSQMFNECHNLSYINVSGLENSHLTDMSSMFANCWVLRSLDLSQFGTSNVTNMHDLFAGCGNLTSINLSNFDTSKVTDMSNMFRSCSNLPAIDLSHFDTKNVTDMSNMFVQCNNLSTVDLSTLDTSSLRYMNSMFQESGVTTVNFGDFNTASVVAMGNLFRDCHNLTEVDLSGFDTSNVTEFNGAELYGYNGFLVNCTNLRSLILPATMECILDLSPDGPPFENVGDEWNPCALTVPDGFTFPEGIDTSAEAFQWGGGWFYLAGTEDDSNMYVVVSNEGKTLTFYCDDLRDTRENTYSVNRGYSHSPVTRVVFDTSFKNARPKTVKQWFAEMSQLVTISGISNLVADNITDMSEMFKGCGSLRSVNLSSLNTENVTNMHGMFQDCGSLRTITLGKIDTGNVTDMSEMFKGCESLSSLNLSNFDTKNVTDMHSMFDCCRSLSSLNLSSFDTKNVTDMRGMFSCCNNLATIDVSTFDTSNLRFMDGMFQDSGIATITFGAFSTAMVESMCSLFNSCSNLTSLDLSGFDTSNITEIDWERHFGYSDLLYNCTSLRSLTLPATMQNIGDFSENNFFTNVGNEWNPCALTVPEGFSFPEDIDVSAEAFQWGGGWFYLNSLTDDSNMYVVVSDEGQTLTFYCDDLRDTHENTYNVNRGYDHSPVTQVEFDESFLNARPTSLRKWFADMTELYVIYGLEYLVTDNVTDMSEMFRNCYNLTDIDLSTFNTEQVTDMHGMFNVEVLGPYYIGVDNFDTSNVTDMHNMFGGCQNLQTLDISMFDTGNVTDMSEMFHDCINLTDIDVSQFNTSNVTDMSGMFRSCSALSTIDVSHFDTSNLQYANSMFENSSLKTIKLGDFSTANVKSMGHMFASCANLDTLDLSGFITDNVQEIDWNKHQGYTNLLRYCSSLRSLTIPASMENIGERIWDGASFEGVGKQWDPCEIYVPTGFDFGLKDEYGNDVDVVKEKYFEWHGGYFLYLLGDANGDRSVNVTDIMMAINKVLGKDVKNFHQYTADINGSGNVNVTDVMGIVRIVLNGSPSSSAPANARKAENSKMQISERSGDIAVMLDTAEPFTACEMVVTVPDGCSLTEAKIDEQRANGHSVVTTDLGDNNYRVLVFSIDGRVLRDNATPFLHLSIEGDKGGKVSISNNQFTNKRLETVILPDVSGITTGIGYVDANTFDNKAPAYSIQGIKTQTPKRGVYIRDGKKIVVK